MNNPDSHRWSTSDLDSDERGITLLEVVIALVLLTITVMGTFAAFTYSTIYNTGNSRRSQALSVLQAEVEQLRSVKFNPPPAVIDPSLAGGVKADKTVIGSDGASYLVQTVVDDDPFTPNTPNPQVDATKTLKEITITVTPAGTNGTWVTANRTRAIFRRVRSN
jgi:type II secretory pathway pseudopilin PulG